MSQVSHTLQDPETKQVWVRTKWEKPVGDRIDRVDVFNVEEGEIEEGGERRRARDT